MDITTIHIVEEGVIAYYKGIAQSLGGQFYDQDEDLIWFRTGRKSIFRFNGVLRARIPSKRLAETTGPILADFWENNLPFFWADYPPSATPGLGEYLAANGITRVAKGMPAMTRSLDDLPPLPPLEKMVISEVRSSRDQAEWLDVHMEGFGEPPEAKLDFQDYLEYTLTRSEWRHFIAHWDGVPCAISTLLCARETAGIYHVTTLPAYRGKGLGKALTLAAMQAGKDCGYTQALLFATPDGFPLYQKLGFQTVLTADAYAWVGGQP
ncbi:MAG: hypothetical protein B6D39_00410 [Anaerolineae bacterium UTCFX2]|jgi:ribosomal protein S18 acetylase RimI-like enzyme|nr:GNAT family N-acetyltransferase [Anaerolineales bacterium]OQY95046.1 MAG: hypothetical protein B6D39_00410 [Anaerolineae bacterium UTCFX2]